MYNIVNFSYNKLYIVFVYCINDKEYISKKINSIFFEDID